MEKHEDTQIRETTDDVIVHELTDENNSPTFLREYLKAGFLSSSVDGLFYARRQAGLTQEQVAEQLNTKQAAIARLEADTNGSMSLRRYVEFTLACGMVPLDITLAPIESVRNFVIAYPDSSLTQMNYDTWLFTKGIPVISAPQSIQPTVTVDQTTTTMPQTTKTSTQNIAGHGNHSVGSEEQSTTNQFQGRLAA
jgi:transcriptional regulator with XRE-family HTH domain